MDVSLAAALGVGFLLGLRHALDADHVAAVSTLVSQHGSVARSCLLGTFWGIGHTTALLAAGLVVIGFKLTISPVLERGLEAVVAFVLVLLGGQVLRRCVTSLSLHRHVHTHDGYSHTHTHVHVGHHQPHRHVHLFRMGRRPFLIGLVHGLAGSAALMLVVLASIPSLPGQFLYIFVFGVGSTGGMLILSGLIGVPVALTAGRSAIGSVVIQSLAGAASLGLGVALLLEFLVGH
jgi:ABC-type nickel/cobalt efflux system permease component RcnA